MPMVPRLADLLAVGETVNAKMTMVSKPSDLAAVSESVTRRIDTFLTKYDSLAASESVKLVLPEVVSRQADDVAVSESVTPTLALSGNLTKSIDDGPVAVSDPVTIRLAGNILRLSTAYTALLQYTRSMADAHPPFWGNPVVRSAASGTEIQWTQSAGGNIIQWVSGRIPSGGFTLSGNVWFDVVAAEGSVLANCGLRARLFRLPADGSAAVEVGGGPFDVGSELPTSLALISWSGTATGTAFSEDDRLLVRFYITNIGTMGGPYDCDLYHGTKAASLPCKMELMHGCPVWQFTVDGGTTVEPCVDDHAAWASCDHFGSVEYRDDPQTPTTGDTLATLQGFEGRPLACGLQRDEHGPMAGFFTVAHGIGHVRACKPDGAGCGSWRPFDH